MVKTQYRLTREEALALNPCDKNKVPAFGRKKYFTPQDAFDAGVSVSDFMWLLGKTGNKWIAVKMAIKYAKSVAHLNPDARVKAAIDAAQACVDNPSAADAAARAAHAAIAAACASYDARSAARAADAAADAAYATTHAAANGAYNAHAAIAAARAAYDADAAADAAGSKLRWIDVFSEVVGA